VPHTLEEAYELADAAHAGDDRRLLDELGDVLFQIHLLSLLLEERGAGDLAAVADHCREKLIRRHPHVFGDVDLDGASEVLENWDRVKREEPGREPGLFGEVPENLPSLLHARKLQRRAAAGGVEHFASVEQALAALETATSVVAAARGRDQPYDELGDLLFAAVAVARKLRVDPELALRSASERFRAAVQDSAVSPTQGEADHS